MQAKFSKLIAIVAFAGLISFANTGIAWERGHVKIEPGFKVEERWDSNIFYDIQSDERGDFITLLTPSVLAEFTFGAEGKHKAIVDYLIECGMFAEYDDQNYGNHDLNTGLALDFDEYTLSVNNEFEFTSSRAGTEWENRVLRKEDTLASVLGCHYNKLDFDVGHKFYIVDYHSDLYDTIDRYENRIWGTGYMEIMSKTKGLLEIGYDNIQYPDTGARNANVYYGMLGAKGDMTAKLTGIIKGGYKRKIYINSSRDDFSGPTAEVALIYDISDRAVARLSYDREPYESIYDNNNYYTGDHFLGDLKYKFGRFSGGDWVGKVEGQYYRNEYPDIAAGEAERRIDHEWAAGCGLDYLWKEWLSAGASYKFHQRESNMDRDYNQHIISGNIAVKF